MKKASFSNGFGFIRSQRGKFESEIIVSKHERKFFYGKQQEREGIQGSPPPPSSVPFPKAGGRRDGLVHEICLPLNPAW